MAWPLSQDYNEAVQNPASSFSDSELREGQPTTNALGFPLPRSGNFADVYEFHCPATQGRWAVKCFTRAVPGLRDRYADISRYLAQANLPFTVDFTYQEQGIRVRGQWYPVLKMRWVEGFLLNEFVRDALDKPALLESLTQIWVRMGRRLREARVAHADLQHGNVLLVPGSKTTSLAVKLVDYDGMCVPALIGSPSGEAGHPAYQHPRRLREDACRPDLDRFPLLVVATALRCLTVGGRTLWDRYDNGDNLLFREADLRMPGESGLFRELWQLGDPLARALVGHLALACQGTLEQVPPVDELLADGGIPVFDAEQEGRLMDLLGPCKVSRTATVPATQASGLDFVGSASVVSSPAGRRRRASRFPGWVQAVAGMTTLAVMVGGAMWMARQGSDAGNEGPAAALRPSGQDKKESPEDRVSINPAPKVKAPDQGAGNEMPAGQPRKAVVKHTPLVRVGGSGGQAFEDLPAEMSLLVGFHFTTVDYGSGVFIKSVQPIYLTAQGRVPGPVHGEPRGNRVKVEARDGYAVGGILAHQNPDDLKIRFMRVKETALDLADTYESPWVCGRFGDTTTLLAGEGQPVVGICGRQGANADALGLMILEDDPANAGFARSLPREEAVGEVRRFECHPGKVWGVAISPDGRLIAAAATDRSLRVWDRASGQELHRFEGSTGQYWKVAFMPDGRSILSTGPENTLRLWDADTGEQLHCYRGHQQGMDGIAVCSDLSRVFSASRDGTCRIWDVTTEKELGRCGQGPLWLYTLAVSPRGDRVLLAAKDNVVCLWDVNQEQELWRKPGHTAHLYAMTISPDGHLGVSAGADRVIRLWDLDTGTEYRRFEGHQAAVHSVAFSPDGRRLLSGSDDKTVRLWDVETGAEVHRFDGHTDAVRSVAVTPDGRYGVSGSADKTVRLWRLPSSSSTSGKSAEREPVAGKPTDKLPVPEGEELAAAENMVKEVHKADYAKRQPADLRALAATLFHEGIETKDKAALRFVLFQEARDLAADAGDPGLSFAAIRELAKDHRVDVLGMKITALERFGRSVTTGHGNKLVVEMALGAMEEALATDHYDEASRLLKIAEAALPKTTGPSLKSLVQARGKEVASWRVEYEQVRGMADRLAKDPKDPEANLILGKFCVLVKGDWSRGLPLLIQGSDSRWKEVAQKDLAKPVGLDRHVEVGDGWWDLAETATESAKKRLQGRAYSWYKRAQPKLTGLIKTRVDQRLTQTFQESPDLETVGLICTLRGHKGNLFGVAISADGQRGLSTSEDKSMRLWDLKTGKELRTFPFNVGLAHVAYTPDGLALFAQDKILVLWNFQTGRVVSRFQGHTGGILSTALSPDGRYLLSGSHDHTARLWEVATGRQIRQFNGHSHIVHAVAISPDGRHVLTGSWDRTVRLWNTSTGKEIRRFEGDAGEVTSVNFSPDGRQALSGGNDKRIRLWDVETGKEMRRFEGHDDVVRSVVFSPDGRRFLSGSYDKTVRLWDVETGKALCRLEGSPGGINDVAFSPDGHRALSGGNEAALCLWGLPRW
jgi:WD40 repeat protein